MQPETDARAIADLLLAVTMSAIASVEADDWETAGQLLRRRDQLLTQLERCADLEPVRETLAAIHSSEANLLAKMELMTRRAFDELNRARDTEAAKRAYGPTPNRTSAFGGSY